jgi:hypothetical protein
MASADEYLAMALDLLAKAEREADPERRVKLEALAESYRHTAELARKPGLVVDFELPSRKANSS